VTSFDDMSMAIAAIVMAVWLGAATVVTIVALRRARQAASALAGVERLRELIAGSPAPGIVIDAEDRIAADARLADWLGLASLPETLDSMAQAFAPDDAVALRGEIDTVRRSGGRFALPLRLAESDRVLTAQGVRSSASGRVLVWLLDSSSERAEIDRLTAEGARLGSAIEALSALIEAAPFPMWHRAPDLRLALVNGAYVRAVEADNAADVIARGLELVEGHEGKGPLAAAAEARERGEISVRKAPATINGERRMLRVVDVPLGASGIAGYAIDIDDLEQARAVLGRFVRAQRDMLDNLSAGVAQFGGDRQLVFSNLPFQRLFAFRAEWLAERPDFDRVLDRMREANRVPESRDFPVWRKERRGWFTAAEEAIEEAWLLPDGTHLRVLANPLPDGGLLVIFEDRTEQVQLASARDTLLRVRTATFDNLFEAIGVFAADGRLHIWNNRFKEVWGLSDVELQAHPRVDALVEKVAERLVTPSRAGLIRDLVRIATTDRQQRSGRVSLTDGRHFDFAAVPLPDGNAMVTMLDVTDSRRIERALRDRNEALEDADRLKTQFVANMSYELRTPLTTIGGFAEMLGAGYAGKLTPTATEYVSAITESVARLGALIDDVLDLSQGDQGMLPLEREKLEIGPLCYDAAEVMRDAAKAKNMDLVVRIEDGTGTVSGDRRRLRQAIDHLLRNAVTYTQAGGRVLLHVSGDKRAATIIVSDNGEGIPLAEQDKIFTRFHRTSHHPSEGRPGTGVGLPVSRQYIEAHGGTLTLESQPGEGTTLTIRLPRK
jgi:signal transduction histidine kinase